LAYISSKSISSVWPHRELLCPASSGRTRGATEDLDVFLPTEVLVSLEQMQALRRAIDRVGFKPVESAKFLHFEKPWNTTGRVKIDMLTGPLPEAVSGENLKFTRPRIRPRGDVELHAYLTEEALDFESSLLPLTIEGVGSDAIEIADAKSRWLVQRSRSSRSPRSIALTTGGR